MSVVMRAAVLVAIVGLGATAASAADYGYAHHGHYRRVVPPRGYAYGGYGNGYGPGWVEAHAPGYAPGITPGYGYIPSGAPPSILDLGY